MVVRLPRRHPRDYLVNNFLKFSNRFHGVKKKRYIVIRDVKFIAVFAEKSGTEAPMNITSDSAPEHFCIHLVQQGLSVLYILRFGQEMFEFC